MDQVDRIPSASSAMIQEREDRFAELDSQADELTAEIMAAHGIPGLRSVVNEVREHEEQRAEMKEAA